MTGDEQIAADGSPQQPARPQIPSAVATNRDSNGGGSPTVNQVPEARTDHTFVRYKNRFYVYGGRDEVQIFKDIHEYSILTN